MNKKIIKIIILVVFVTSLTGCTKLLKDDNGKVVQNPKTGQNLPQNILCQPESSSTIDTYKKAKLDISNLPKCSQFTITSGGYEGIWNTIFVKPLAWLIIQAGNIVKSYGLAIVIITLIIRLILYPITKKTALQSENLKKAQPELERLEKKYPNSKDQQMMMLKSQEMMNIYKKYQINPLSGCLFAFIQIPLFFAFYESLNRLPAVFEENFIGFQLGTTPLIGMGNGHYFYIIVCIIIILVTYFSFKLNQTGSITKEQEKQMKMMTNIMIVFIGIASFTLPIAIGIYWIINSSFTIFQNLFIRRIKND